MSQSGYARALIDGEMDGDACVFKVYDYGFLTKTITSSSKVAKASATITVTLRSNVDLLSSGALSSKITLSGLTGSNTPDTTDLTILTASNGNVATAFSPSFSAVDWKQST